MANMCSNATAVVGPRDDLIRLRKRLIENFPVELGAPDDEPQLFDDHLRVNYQTKWGPSITEWNEFLSREFPTLKQFTLAEECGSSIYVNTDSDGMFFDTRYYIDGYAFDSFTSDGGEQYQPTLDGVLAAINSWLHRFHVGPFPTIEDARKYVHASGGEDAHLDIYEYSYDW